MLADVRKSCFGESGSVNHCLGLANQALHGFSFKRLFPCLSKEATWILCLVAAYFAVRDDQAGP